MSRLLRHQKKIFLRTIIFYGVLIVGLFIFILTIGLKLLLNASVFIAQLTAKNSPNTQNVSEDFIGTIDVGNIPSATNSSQIIVSGSILNFDLLEFFINGEKVKEKNVGATDTFSEEIGDLTVGDNEVYVNAIAKDSKKQKKSTTYHVFYKKDKPKLEISEPKDGSTVNQSEINVKGSTDKETFIRIQDSPIVVDSQGNFQTTLKLQSGENKILVVAQDVAGNSEEKIISLTYQKED